MDERGERAAGAERRIGEALQSSESWRRPEERPNGSYRLDSLLWMVARGVINIDGELLPETHDASKQSA